MHMRYKEKCGILIPEKDELINNMSIGKPINVQSHNNNAENAQMIVQLNELERKLQQKEDEVKSKEILMKQLIEQQTAFQKRNKTLVRRLKAIQKQNNLSGNFNINKGIFMCIYQKTFFNFKNKCF